KLSLPPYEPSAADYDVSPDGKELCFVADSAKEIGMDVNYDLYALTLDGKGNPRNLTTDNQANDSSPVYIPDGKSVAFLRQTTKYFYADRNRLMVLDRATGKAKEWTAEFDRSFAAPRWIAAAKGPMILAEAEDRGQVRVFVISGEGGVTPLTEDFTDH